MATVGRTGYMSSMALAAAALAPGMGGPEIHHTGLAPNLDLFGGGLPRPAGNGFTGFKSTNKKHNTRDKLKTARKRQKQARKKQRGR